MSFMNSWENITLYQNIRMCNTDYTEATDRRPVDQPPQAVIPLQLSNHSVLVAMACDYLRLQ
jgi:hypothetical protein